MVVEHGFDERLAVVKRAAYGEGVNVLLLRRRHHAPLDVGHAALRKEDDDVDALRSSECLDRGSARIARSGADDRRALAALCEHVVHQPCQELHCDVLERERRTVEELEDRQARLQLVKRRHFRAVEACIGFFGHAGQVGARDVIAGEGVDDIDGDLGERFSGERGYRRGAQNRPARGHIEAAVARETSEDDVLESKLFDFATR